MSDALDAKDDIVELRQNIIGLIRVMFKLPVEIGTPECKIYLQNNPGCGNCFSYHGCCLMLTVLNWVADEDNYSRGALKQYMKGLYAGYFLNATGVPAMDKENEEKVI